MHGAGIVTLRRDAAAAWIACALRALVFARAAPRVVAALALLLGAACAGDDAPPTRPVVSAPPPGPPRPSTQNQATQRPASAPSAPAQPSATGTGCSPASPLARLVLPTGRSVSTASGLEITFRGASHDDFEGGKFDESASFHFRRGADQTDRTPSVLAPDGLEEVLGHCWRSVGVTPDEATIELALAGAPARLDGPFAACPDVRASVEAAFPTIPPADLLTVVEEVRQAIGRRDTAAIARASHFPLRVFDGPRHTRVRSASELARRFDEIFPPAVLQRLARPEPCSVEAFTDEGLYYAGTLNFPERVVGPIRLEQIWLHAGE